MYEKEYEKHISARRVKDQLREEPNAPFNVERNAVATLYTNARESTLDTVLQRILKGEWRENSKQEKFLLKPNQCSSVF